MDHVRDMSQIADIKETMVGWPVIAGKPRSIHAKRNIQILQRNIMYEHVVGPLHEGRINGQKRLKSLGCKSAREQRRVLFSDADIEILGRMLSGKVKQAGT